MKRDERIADFWQRAPRAVREVAAWVRTNGFEPEPTGSRLFCPHSMDGGDWDLHFVANNEWIAEQQNEWDVRTGSTATDGLSLKRTIDGHVINLICHYSEETYQDFAAATALCAAMGGPENKGERIVVFEAVMHEKALANLNPFDDWQDWPQEPFDLLVAADAWEEIGETVKGEFLRNPTFAGATA